MKAYKRQGRNGIEYELEDGVVFKEYSKESGLFDQTYHIFQDMVKRGDVEIVDYEGSDKHQSDLERFEISWASSELAALKEEAINHIINTTPTLKAWRDKLKAHKDNPNSQRPTRY